MKFRNRYSDFGIGASLNDHGRSGGTQKFDQTAAKEDEFEVVDFEWLILMMLANYLNRQKTGRNPFTRNQV